jgi:hypothetical protein
MGRFSFIPWAFLTLKVFVPEIASDEETGPRQDASDLNPMSMHALFGLNSSAGIDYSETNIPGRPSNLVWESSIYRL